jgi:hypothetical protein
MPEYFDHDDVRTTAIETATACEDCAVTELDLVEGAATHYVFCDSHHRELYARYAEVVTDDATDENEGEEGLSNADIEALEAFGVREAVDIERGRADVDVGRLAAGLDGDSDDAKRATRALDAVAAAEPERVVPAVETLVRATELETGHSIADILGKVAVVDSSTRDLLVTALGRPVEWRGAAARSLESVAEHDTEALLAAGDPVSRDGRTVPRIVDALGTLVARGQSVTATGLLLVIARRQPGSLRPVIGDLAEGLYATNARTRFQIAAVLGRAIAPTASGGGEPVDDHVVGADMAGAGAGVGRVNDRLVALCEADGAPDRATGAVALAYWPEEDRPVDSPRLRTALRELIDPTEYGHDQIQEAVAALGQIATEADRHLLEWIKLPTLPARIHRAADEALAGIDARTRE